MHRAGRAALLLMGSSVANAQGAPRQASSLVLTNSLNRKEEIKRGKHSLWEEGAKGRGEMLRFCLGKRRGGSSSAFRSPGSDANQRAVFSDSRKCKLTHYLPASSKTASHTSPPFPPLCWGRSRVPLRLWDRGRLQRRPRRGGCGVAGAYFLESPKEIA